MTGPSFLEVAVPALFAYLLGALPFGYLFVRLTRGEDVRTMGSGNIGATNVHRSAGKKAGLIVLLLDIGKGLLAVWIASAFSHGSALVIAIALLAVMLGHCYPVFLGFRGGKAVACYIGAALFISPQALLATAVIFVLVVALTKYISLGSLVGAVVFPIMLWVTNRPAASIEIASVIAGAIIIARHHANLARLQAGTEHTFSLKGAAR